MRIRGRLPPNNRTVAKCELFKTEDIGTVMYGFYEKYIFIDYLVAFPNLLKIVNEHNEMITATRLEF